MWGFNEKNKQTLAENNNNKIEEELFKIKQQQPDFLSFFVKKEQTLSNWNLFYVALSPTIKRNTSLKSFEKKLQQIKNCCQAATKPRSQNKRNPPTGYPVSNLKKKKSGNRIMIFLLLQCPSSLYVIRKKQHFALLFRQDWYFETFCVALWWDYNN